MLAKSIFMAVLLSVPVVLATGPAAADPWKDESGNSKYARDYEREYKYEYKYKEERRRDRHGYKYEWQDGNCKYKYKKGKHGYKEERKCKGGAHYTGGPPPWAPAHGYRARQGRGYPGSTQTTYVPPFDLNRGRCNRELLGSLLGAAAGGLAGSRIGDGRGQLAATAGGTLLGFLIGGTIGRNMDEVDQNCVGQALEHAQDGQQIAWNNSQTGAQYQVVPTRTVQGSDGRYCREYTATSVVSGRNQQTYGRACRQPDGSWQIVQ
jgi:surface antigen